MKKLNGDSGFRIPNARTSCLEPIVWLRRWPCMLGSCPFIPNKGRAFWAGQHGWPLAGLHHHAALLWRHCPESPVDPHSTKYLAIDIDCLINVMVMDALGLQPSTCCRTSPNSLRPSQRDSCRSVEPTKPSLVHCGRHVWHGLLTSQAACVGIDRWHLKD